MVTAIIAFILGVVVGLKLNTDKLVAYCEQLKKRLQEILEKD